MIFAPDGLLIEAIVAAICGWLFGARWGAFAFALLLLLASAFALIFIPSVSKDASAWIGFTLAFGLIFILGASTLGLFSGVNLRQGQYLVGAALLSPVVLLWSFSAGSTADIAKKQSLAVEFVKGNREVARAAGRIEFVFPESVLVSRSGLPSRIIVAVNTGERFIYPVLDISRSWGGPTFELACISSISPGQRDPVKDVCAQ